MTDTLWHLVFAALCLAVWALGQHIIGGRCDAPCFVGAP